MAYLKNNNLPEGINSLPLVETMVEKLPWLTKNIIYNIIYNAHAKTIADMQEEVNKSFSEFCEREFDSPSFTGSVSIEGMQPVKCCVFYHKTPVLDVIFNDEERGMISGIFSKKMRGGL